MTSCDCCGKCAYLDKSTKKLWCPFHDEPVSSNMVCDHFLDEHESPQWASLISRMSKNENKETIKQFTGKDLTAYALSLLVIFLSIACIVM